MTQRIPQLRSHRQDPEHVAEQVRRSLAARAEQQDAEGSQLDIRQAGGRILSDDVGDEIVERRLASRLNLAAEEGMNAHDPSIQEQISEAILGSLGVPEARSAESQRPAPDALTAVELVGRYVGISGVDVAVNREGQGLVCIVGGEAGGAALQVAMGLAADGNWVVRSEAKRLALGFFREPHAGTPCLMLGQSAFKRV